MKIVFAILSALLVLSLFIPWVSTTVEFAYRQTTVSHSLFYSVQDSGDTNVKLIFYFYFFLAMLSAIVSLLKPKVLLWIPSLLSWITLIMCVYIVCFSVEMLGDNTVTTTTASLFKMKQSTTMGAGMYLMLFAGFLLFATLIADAAYNNMRFLWVHLLIIPLSSFLLYMLFPIGRMITHV
ncbi:hypothetical protein LJC12_04905 [Odoribacter sp. OttesenSCG-928-J03]|nr:hypothetical protein [Odoribacter sp. OttesenSCG-928-J03]